MNRFSKAAGRALVAACAAIVSAGIAVVAAEATAIAVSRNAVVESLARDDKSSTIQWTIAGAPARRVEVDGDVAALGFGPDGGEAFAILTHHRRRAPDEVSLARLVVEGDGIDVARTVRLPESARDLDVTHDGLLVIACEDELRSFRLPALSSGPLFALPGRHVAVAALARGREVLVARDDSLLLVDLDDPQGIDGLPVREEIALSSPATRIVADPGGDRAWVLSGDGSVRQVDLDPMREGRETETSWRTVLDRIAATPPSAAPRAPVARPPAPPPPPPPPSPAPEPEVAEERAPIELPPPVPEPVVEVKPRAPEPEPEPEPEPMAPPSATGTISGTISGPAASGVGEVVVLGPDNILREAGSAKPSPDGRWSLAGLAPGSYRVVVRGKEGRPLETRPAFVTATVGAEGGVTVDRIEVVRAF